MSVDVTALSISVTSTGITQASQALGGLSTSAANATKRINDLIAVMQKLGTMGATINITGASTAGLTAAINALNNTIVILNQRTQQADQSQRRHNDGMREAHGLARGLAGSMGALWLTYGNLAGMAAGVAIGASLKAIVTIGKDVEHTLEGIRVKGMESVAAIDKLRDAVYNIGTGVYGPLEVAKAFDTLVMAGLSAEKAAVGIKDALNLALIGGTSIDKAAFTLVQVSTALGYTAEGFSRVGDVIAKTAAVSMSSVESLSEAFKSGSVVGKLYGISLQDIGTAFAALSNLGIRGSAAGTSLKNMYKELAADSDKLKNTLNLIGLKPQQLKDAEGNFKPMIELFATLDKALGSYTAAEQKTLMARLANERGMKSLVEILSLYREKVSQAGDGSQNFANRLQIMNDAINESYGFMAQGAAAMALTVDSQFKSVANTLQVTLAKAFQGIQPELSLVARNLKQTFGSTEFISTVQALAMAVAKLTLFVADNAEALAYMLRVLLSYKAAMMVVGVLTGIGTAITTIRTTLLAASTAALTFQASLGVLGIALGLAAAAMVWWKTKKDEATTDAKSRAAINYVEDFTDKLKENTEQLGLQITAMLQGASAADAYTEAQQRLQLQKVKEQNQQIVVSAQQAKGAFYQGLEPYAQKSVRKYADTGEMPAYSNGVGRSAVKEYIEYQERVNDAKRTAARLDKEAEDALRMNTAVAKELARITDETAKANGRTQGGELTIPEEVKRAAELDAMNKRLKGIQGEVEDAKKAAEQAKQNAQSEYRQGVIGELELIERVKNAEVDRQAGFAIAAEAKIAILRKHKDQESAIANEYNNAYAALQATKDAQRDAENARAEYATKVAQDTLKAQAEAYLKNGQFVEAFKAEQGRKHDLEAQRLVDNYNKSTDAAERFNIMMLVFANEEAKAAGIKVAANKEAEISFNTLAEATRNSMKGIQTANEGQGLAAMWTAAQEASAKYAAELPALKAAMESITDGKGKEEAQAKLTNLAETQRKMWVGVGESISNSLENAFGKGGKAAADLFKVAQNYSNLEKKDGSARIKAYGDAAGAAKNFFKESTTGYKIMEGAEKAFRAIELAGMIKSLVMTGTTEAGKQAFKVPTVLMEFMSQLGPWGMAAGVAAIAAIGVSASGGGGGPVSAEQRQKTQGTGSVLGDSDAKSASIANSLEIMERNSGLGLAQGNQMVGYLRTVADNISALASLIVRTTGISGATAPDTSKFENNGLLKALAPIGGKFVAKVLNSIFGGSTSVQDTGFALSKTTVGNASTRGVTASQYTDVKKDGGWFRSDKYSTDMKGLGADANAQFSLTIKSLADTIKEAGTQLGFGGDAFNARLESFVVDLGKVSLKGMTGSQVQEALSAVFSKLGDDMAKFAIVGLDKFQQVGEGYLETVARIANNLMQVRDVFAVLDKTFALTGMAAINVSEGLIAAAGGIEKLTDGTKYFVDNFLTEAERMAPITASVNAELNRLNMSDIKTIDLYKKKIRSLDLTNAADQQLYAELVRLAPAFKEAADYADELANGVVKLSKAQQKALDAVNKAKDNLQKAYEKESTALQSTIDKTKAFITTLKNYQDSIKLGADSPLTNMQKYAEARKQFEATANAARGGDQGARDKLTGAASALLTASKVINASGDNYTSDFNMVQNLLDEMIGSATSQVDVAQASLDALNKQVEGLIKLNDSVMSVTQAVQELKNAIISGGLAGLTNTQMETTYTPTSAEVNAVVNPNTPTITQAGLNELIGSVDKVVAKLEEIKVNATVNTGAVVGATIKASEENAEAITGGVGGALQKSNITKLSYV